MKWGLLAFLLILNCRLNNGDRSTIHNDVPKFHTHSAGIVNLGTFTPKSDTSIKCNNPEHHRLSSILEEHSKKNNIYLLVAKDVNDDIELDLKKMDQETFNKVYKYLEHESVENNSSHFEDAE